MFRIVKYLNHVHSGIFEKMDVLSAAKELVQEIGGTFRSDDPADMLNFFRLLERDKHR